MKIFVCIILLLSYALPVVSAGELDNKYHEQNTNDLKLYGTIEKMPEHGYAGVWIVSGREIIVTDSTVIKMRHGIPGEGAYIAVEGRYFGQELSAYEIEVKRDHGK